MQNRDDDGGQSSDEGVDETTSLLSRTNEVKIDISFDNNEFQKQSYKDREKERYRKYMTLHWWEKRLRKNYLGIVVMLIVALIMIGMALFVWTHFGWKAWYSLGVIALTFYLLINSVAEPDVIMLFTTALLLAGGVIKPSEAIEGLASVGVLTISVLFVVAAAIAETGSIQYISKYIMGNSSSLRLVLFRMMVPLAALSGFTNNAPLTAIMIPVVEKWCRENKQYPSKLMIPVSYATILGGVCTLIGTSTNLIVVGFANDRDASLHFPFFEIGIIGVPIAITGLIYMVILAPWLLPDRTNPAGDFFFRPREYTLTLTVREDSPLIGKSLTAGGLNSLEGLVVVGFWRGGTSSPPEEVESLKAGDSITFVGDVSKLRHLFQLKGLQPTNQEEEMVHPSSDRILVEAVVSPRSELVGERVSRVDFGERFKAAVVAIHEARNPVHDDHQRRHWGESLIKPGDTLLMVCKKKQIEDNKFSTDFLMMSEVGGGSLKQDYFRMLLAPAAAITMILLSTLELTSLFTSALCAAFFLILTGCLTVRQAVVASNFRLIVMIASSFGMATALENTGVAAQLGHDLVNLLKPLGGIGLVYSVYLSTAILTAILSNASSAALMIPIVFSFDPALTGVNIKAFVYAIMVAASADFSTPIGYQTNLMVWGPGGYKFLDYARVGFPLQVVESIVSSIVIYYVFA